MTVTPAAAINRMPPGWAKRRLAEEGPAYIGTDEARMAALALAAEFRSAGVTEADTLAYVTSRLDVFQTGKTRGNSLLKQLKRSIHLAYNPPSGLPILSGCCRDPRPRTGSKGTGALRRTFEPYCDQDCERVCPMLRAIRNPERSLYGTEYEALDQSNLWSYGTKIGEAGRLAFQMIALLALASGEQEVQASRRFLCTKSGGRFSASAFGKALNRLDELELVRLLDRKTALRRIEPWSEERVGTLEADLGVAGRKLAHVREARRESEDYLSWLHRELTSIGDEDAMEAWDPPARAGT